MELRTWEIANWLFEELGIKGIGNSGIWEFGKLGFAQFVVGKMGGNQNICVFLVSHFLEIIVKMINDYTYTMSIAAYNMST